MEVLSLYQVSLFITQTTLISVEAVQYANADCTGAETVVTNPAAIYNSGCNAGAKFVCGIGLRYFDGSIIESPTNECFHEVLTLIVKNH